MIMPAIITLLFILTIGLVGGYFMNKEEKKWEDALMRYIEERVKEAQANENNENNENKKVEANATTFKRD